MLVWPCSHVLVTYIWNKKNKVHHHNIYTWTRHPHLVCINLSAFWDMMNCTNFQDISYPLISHLDNCLCHGRKEEFFKFCSIFPLKEGWTFTFNRCRKFMPFDKPFPCFSPLLLAYIAVCYFFFHFIIHVHFYQYAQGSTRYQYNDVWLSAMLPYVLMLELIYHHPMHDLINSLINLISQLTILESLAWAFPTLVRISNISVSCGSGVSSSASYPGYWCNCKR